MNTLFIFYLSTSQWQPLSKLFTNGAPLLCQHPCLWFTITKYILKKKKKQKDPNKPLKRRNYVTPLPAPRASPSAAGKVFSANLVAKMPVKLIIHMMNTLLSLVYQDKLERITVALRAGRNDVGAPQLGCAQPNSVIKPFRLEERS